MILSIFLFEFNSFINGSNKYKSKLKIQTFFIFNSKKSRESPKNIMRKSEFHQTDLSNQSENQALLSQIIKESTLQDFEKELSKSKLLLDRNEAQSQNQKISQTFSQIYTQRETLNKKQSQIMEQIMMEIQKQKYQSERLKVDGMILEKSIQQLKNQLGIVKKIKQSVLSIKQNSNTQFKFSKIQKIWQQIQNIQDISTNFARLICDNYMNDQLLQNEKKISHQNLLNQLKVKAKEKPISIENVILILFDLLEQYGSTVILEKQSSVQSQITFKYLVGGLLNNTVMVKQTISDNDQTCPFTFDQLLDQKVFCRFDSWYRNKISKQTGINFESIVIHSVAKGSIITQWSTDQAEKLEAAVKGSPDLQDRLDIHPFLQTFRISPQDFDSRGDIKFKDVKKKIEFRGGWPYYQPTGCSRFGLNVSKKYDQGKDRWLEMKGKPGEWAVGFHGVRYPKNKCKDRSGNQVFVFESIMSGREMGEMLMEGYNQVYASQKPVNKPNQNVGKGIYFSPHFQVSLSGYTPSCKTQGYALIFQCRINSKQIKVCRGGLCGQTYWAINKSKDVRPYGIILVQKKVKDNYPKIQQQFGKKFVYKDYKDKIESYLNSSN